MKTFLKHTTWTIVLFWLVVSFMLYAQDLAVLDGDNPEELFHQANYFQSVRKLNQAKEKYSKLIEKYPKHTLAFAARIELAKIMYDLREFDKAFELLQPMIDSNQPGVPKNVARELMIKFLEELQRFKQGTDLLEKWWKENPNDIEIGRRLASFYLQTGKPDEARLLLEGLLERTADRNVFQDLLKFATKSGTVDLLLSSIEQRRFKYRTLDFLDFVTDCYIALGKKEKAAEILRNSPEASNSIVLLKKLGRLDFANKQYDKAAISFKKIKERSPMDWENTKILGDCYFKLGNKSEAIKQWSEPVNLRLYPIQEGYQMVADVLIEHQLYQEALDVLAEARIKLGSPNLFAEDRARVLESMGRQSEALDEYLTVLKFGVFRQDIFEKLYKSQNQQFVLRVILKDLLKKYNSIALKKALIEVLFLDKPNDAITEILQLAENDSEVRSVLLERIQQAVSEDPSNFLQDLIIALIRQHSNNLIAYKLGLILLQLPDQETMSEKRSIEEIETLLKAASTSDFEAIIKLQVELAKFYLERLNDVARAVAHCQDALDSGAETIYPTGAFDALLLLMKASVMKGDFTKAEEYKSRAENLNLLRDDEMTARLLYETAWMNAHQGKYEMALANLKKITDEYSDSFWLNDALSLGLFLTMGSTGGLDALGKYLAAERAAGSGKIAEAIDMFKSISKIASDSPLAKDSEAKVLLLSEEIATSSELINLIDEWTSKNPTHWLIPDLFMVKWRLMNRYHKEKESEIVDLLKEFLDRFPGDLRSRRVKLALQEMMREKGKK